MLSYRNMIQRALTAFVIGVTFCLLSATARAVVIDDFSIGPITVAGPAVQSQSGLDPSHVLGGSRAMNVGQFGNGSVLEVDPASGLSFHSTGWGYFNLQYDLSDGGAATDLTAGGHDRIRLRFGEVQTSYTLFGLYLTLPPNSSNNGVSLAIQNWDGLILEVPFSALPASPTAAESLTVSVSRNPAGSSFVIESITTAGTPNPGDFNRDGDVNLYDYDVWRRFAGISTRDGVKWAIASADGNADGRVDGADFVIWQKFAAISPPGDGTSFTAPEPAAIIPILCAVVIGQLRLMRQSQWRTPSSISGVS